MYFELLTVLTRIEGLGFKVSGFMGLLFFGLVKY